MKHGGPNYRPCGKSEVQSNSWTKTIHPKTRGTTQIKGLRSPPKITGHHAVISEMIDDQPASRTHNITLTTRVCCTVIDGSVGRTISSSARVINDTAKPTAPDRDRYGIDLYSALLWFWLLSIVESKAKETFVGHDCGNFQFVPVRHCQRNAPWISRSCEK